MPKPNWLDRSAFALPFAFTLVTSAEMFGRVLKDALLEPEHWPRWINEGANATTHTFPHAVVPKCKSGIVIVCIEPRVQDGIVTAGLLVHEATHVFQRSCEEIGEESPSKEFEAYSIQWISQCLMWEYRSQVFPQAATKE